MAEDVPDFLPAEPGRDGPRRVGDDLDDVGLPFGQVVRVDYVVEDRGGVAGDEDVPGERQWLLRS